MFKFNKSQAIHTNVLLIKKSVLSWTSYLSNSNPCESGVTDKSTTGIEVTINNHEKRMATEKKLV